MSAEAIKAETSDSAGREVILSEERWTHICDGHPELEQHLEDLLRAVAEPSTRLPGRDEREELLYRLTARNTTRTPTCSICMLANRARLSISMKRARGTPFASMLKAAWWA